jgi:hypothetical protein
MTLARDSCHTALPAPLIFQALWVVAGSGNQDGRRLRSNAESFSKSPSMLSRETLQHGIECLEFFV